MIRFFSIVFALIGGLVGWKLGTVTGLLRAYFASVLGSAGGLVLGRRFAENLLK